MSEDSRPPRPELKGGNGGTDPGAVHVPAVEPVAPKETKDEPRKFKRTGILKTVFLHPVSVEDVADALQTTPGNVRIMMHRGELPDTVSPRGWKRRYLAGRVVKLPPQGDSLLRFALRLVKAALRRGILVAEDLEAAPRKYKRRQEILPPEVVEAGLLLDAAKAERAEAERIYRQVRKLVHRGQPVPPELLPPAGVGTADAEPRRIVPPPPKKKASWGDVANWDAPSDGEGEEP